MRIKELIGTERFNNIKDIANAYLGKAGKLTNSLVEDLLYYINFHYTVMTNFKGNYFKDMCDIDIGTDVYGAAYNNGITYNGVVISFAEQYPWLYEKLNKAIKRG